MKTVLFLIAVLLFPSVANAELPLVVLKMGITNGAKVFTTSHMAADNRIPTGIPGATAWGGYLLEDLPPGPLDTTLQTRMSLMSRIIPTNIWTPPLRKYVLVFIYKDAIPGVLAAASLTVTDLSGLGICDVIPDSTDKFVRVESCVGTSNGTGDLATMDHLPFLAILSNNGERQFRVVLVEAIDAATGDDLLGETGCDPTGGPCTPFPTNDLSFTVTHYGRDPAVYGIGNGPGMKADSATMEGLLGVTCDHAREIVCTDETLGVSCRQPHICNTWGDVDGDNFITASDTTDIGNHTLFNVPLNIGPDDNRFGPFDPSPFGP